MHPSLYERKYRDRASIASSRRWTWSLLLSAHCRGEQAHQKFHLAGTALRMLDRSFLGKSWCRTGCPIQRCTNSHHGLLLWWRLHCRVLCVLPLHWSRSPAHFHQELKTWMPCLVSRGLLLLRLPTSALHEVWMLSSGSMFRMLQHWQRHVAGHCGQQQATVDRRHTHHRSIRLNSKDQHHLFI